jgi:hypothetical protein
LRFDNDVDMAGRLGMNQLVGEFFRHARHEIPVLAEKGNMLVIRGGLEGIDLDGIRAPVLEKRSERQHGQGTGLQLTHERPIGHPLPPARRDFAVVLVDVFAGLILSSHGILGFLSLPKRAV